MTIALAPRAIRPLPAVTSLVNPARLVTVGDRETEKGGLALETDVLAPEIDALGLTKDVTDAVAAAGRGDIRKVT